MGSVIIDAVVVCILLAFTAYGAHRGAFRALAGLLIAVISLVGANSFATRMTPAAVNALTPVIEQRMEARVDEALTSQPVQPESSVQEQVESLLQHIGIDSSGIQGMADSAAGKIRETGIALATAVVKSLAASVLHGVLFLLSFVALLLILKLAAHAVHLMMHLPVLHSCDTLLGGVIGLIEGGLFLFFLIWIARRLGISFETELVSATHLLRFFTTNTPLDVLSLF